jgi:hypothetical protein
VGGAGGNLSGSEGVPAGEESPQGSTAKRDTLPTGRVSASTAKVSVDADRVRSRTLEKIGVGPAILRFSIRRVGEGRSRIRVTLRTHLRIVK